jgi:hypothetical protein
MASSRLPKTVWPQWELDLLKAINAPLTNTNLVALNFWSLSEGSGALNGNNPLSVAGDNKTASPNGVIAPNNGDPVYSYPTLADGIKVTVHNLQTGGGPGNAGGDQAIIKALQNKNSSLMDIWKAINSNWNGKADAYPASMYPSALADAMNTDYAGNQTLIFGGSGYLPVANDSTTNPGAPGVTQTPPNNPSGNPAPAKDTTPKGECDSSDCLFGEGGVIFGIGSACFLNKCQAKAIVGGIMVASGAGIMLLGTILLAVYGLQKSETVRSAEQVAGGVAGGLAIAGAPEAAAPIEAGRRTSRTVTRPSAPAPRQRKAAPARAAAAPTAPPTTAAPKPRTAPRPAPAKAARPGASRAPKPEPVYVGGQRAGTRDPSTGKITWEGRRR